MGRKSAEVKYESSFGRPRSTKNVQLLDIRREATLAALHGA
jgi:hypothetical protein